MTNQPRDLDAIIDDLKDKISAWLDTYLINGRQVYLQRWQTEGEFLEQLYALPDETKEAFLSLYCLMNVSYTLSNEWAIHSSNEIATPQVKEEESSTVNRDPSVLRLESRLKVARFRPGFFVLLKNRSLF